MRKVASKSSRGQGKADVTITRGSGNVFADMGLAEPELLQAKCELVYRITTILSARRLTQREAGRILGIDQPGVSDLIRGHLDRFSSDRLIRFLNALGHDVELVVSSRSSGARRAGRLSVRNAAAPTAAVRARARA